MYHYCHSSLTLQMNNGDHKMIPVEYCPHDDVDSIAASLADDIVAKGDDAFLVEFKER